MSVYATGDTHGNFLRFEEQHFPEQEKMARSDYMIICGTLGVSGTENRRMRKHWTNWKPCLSRRFG